MRSSFALLALAGLVAAARPARLDRVRRAEFTLANGKAAQAINAQTASLSPDDACTAGEQACFSSGSFGQCVDGKWAVTPCSGGLSCFALVRRSVAIPADDAAARQQGRHEPDVRH